MFGSVEKGWEVYSTRKPLRAPGHCPWLDCHESNVIYVFLTTERFLEIPGEFGHSVLQLYHQKFRQAPKQFAWMTGFNYTFFS